MSTTFSSREFNQDTGRAKKAAAEGPVFITDRGKPAHVLLSIEDYRKLTEPETAKPDKGKSILDLLYMPEIADIDLEIPQRRISPLRDVDLS